MRRLKKNITRRVENMVVSLTPEGVTLRGIHKRVRSAKLVTWDDLALAAGANISSNRGKAFEYLPMPGWVPKPRTLQLSPARSCLTSRSKRAASIRRR